jgi:flagellar basal body-associated protein FliL
MKDRLLDKIIRFDILLGIVASVIALVAAFFSVYGIATLFAGAFLSTVVMGTALEVGKLVAVTYLYRYWKQTKVWLATYLSLALVILMFITSLGIFGYLSSAYQKSATAYKAQQDQIVMIENTKTYAQNKVDQAKTRILTLTALRTAQETRMSEAMTNMFISRNAITLKQIQEQTGEMIKATEADVKAEQGKIDAGIQEMGDIDKKVSAMKYADNSKDIRTFEFVATLFHTNLDTVAKWFIFLLISVFDPLAIALILAYNVVVYKKPVDISHVHQSESISIEPEDKKTLQVKSSAFPFQKIPKNPSPALPPESISDTLDPHDHAPAPSDADAFMKGYFKS